MRAIFAPGCSLGARLLCLLLNLESREEKLSGWSGLVAVLHEYMDREGHIS